VPHPAPVLTLQPANTMPDMPGMDHGKM